LVILLAAGCEDATFDLLPPPPAEATAGTGGDTDGPPATGGTAGKNEGAGGTAGSGATGGTGPPPQTGCEFDPNPDCQPCEDSRDCEGTSTPICMGGRCIECRLDYECPYREGCAYDCNDPNDPDPKAACDAVTHRCAPTCWGGARCPPELRHCDGKQHGWVCTECDVDPSSPDNRCPNGLVCHYALAECVECWNAYHCGDLACDARKLECRPCMNDYECNPFDDPNFWRVCENGRCEPPP